MLTTILIITGLIILAAAVISIADNLIQIEAKKSGLDTQKENYSLFPRVTNLFKSKAPSFADPDKFHSLSKGHNIKMTGAAQGTLKSANVNRFAIQPGNFRGIAPIPKLMVAIGDEVKAGDPLFYDKTNPEVKYVSPVSGEVVEINRGAKRSIAEVVVLADKNQQSRSIQIPDLNSASRDEIQAVLRDAGAWVTLNARPFDIIPDPAVIPRDIFISTFDTAPLAPNMDLVIDGNKAAFQKGVDVLAKLTDGQVYLSLDASNNGSTFSDVTGAEKHWFKGPHPAGNVGIQMHHIKPIGKDTVWTAQVQDVINIGNLFLTGSFQQNRIVAITGGGVANPHYVKTYVGAHLGELLKDNVSGENLRVISGDVLSGATKSPEQYLNYKDDQVTVIPEGDHFEMFGWLLPISPRPSVSGTFPNFLFPNHEFDVDTNTHGEKRAFVMTGEYEKMLPMDILPMHLMKAVVTNDYERMEGLGITELSEEDIAICEFACTSKQPLQQILREGLDMLQEQL